MADPSPRGAGGHGIQTVLDVGFGAIHELGLRYDLECVLVSPGAAIPASFWGDSEAGLRGSVLYLRADTPLHSALHEMAHFVCMDASRRRDLDRDAGGDHAEENAVCYLQILLADYIAGSDRARMCRDMDAWGYTFRLGSARAWFEHEAADATLWLHRAGIIDAAEHLTWHRAEGGEAALGLAVVESCAT